MALPTEETPEAPVRRKPGPKPKVLTDLPAAAVTHDDSHVDNSALSLNDDVARIAAMRKRQPFGSYDRKLDLQPIEGYKQHWFVAKPGRLERALAAGWTYILDDEGKPRSMVGGSDGVRQYAMKIPMQFWLEDQARSDSRAKTALDAVKKQKPSGQGVPGASAVDGDKFYTPDGKASAVTSSR